MKEKIIDYDIAHALVNYQARSGDIDSMSWGYLSATDIRHKLVDMKERDGKIRLTAFNNYLAENETDKLWARANSNLIRLRQLCKLASN